MEKKPTQSLIETAKELIRLQYQHLSPDMDNASRTRRFYELQPSLAIGIVRSLGFEPGFVGYNDNRGFDYRTRELMRLNQVDAESIRTEAFNVAANALSVEVPEILLHDTQNLWGKT